MDINIEPLAGLLSVLLLLVTLGAFLEMGYLAFYAKKAGFRHVFLQPLKSFALLTSMQFVVGRVAAFMAVAGMAAFGASLAPVSLPNAWWSWLIALAIYEFWYWLQHMMAHKVRLLWCIHSPHHAPDSINLLIGFNHQLIESLLYFPIFIGLLPALCGVPIEMILILNLIDYTWGSLLHVSADVVKRRYGPLEYCMQTPSYHRAHHAKNVRYLDTNYNAITLFWDWVFGTLQVLRKEDTVDYGITRDVDVESFRDVHFGEFSALWRDLKSAPELRDKIKYLLMPPGWSADGKHKTVAVQKRAFTAEQTT